LLAVRRQRSRAEQRKRDAHLPQVPSYQEVVTKMSSDLVFGSLGEDAGDSITLHTWDFAGQAIYYDTHHLFVTRGVYLLVFDLDDARKGMAASLKSLSFWLSSLETQIEDPEDFGVILVGTHADIVSEHDDHYAISVQLKAALGTSAAWDRLAQPPRQCATPLCFFPVNNTTPHGSSMLHSEIQRLAEGIVERKPEYPVEWLGLVDVLQAQANSGVNYMPVYAGGAARAAGAFSIHDLAQHAGIHGQRTMDFCEFCDEMGMFRLFKTASDGPTLILRPQWLVDVFSSVITQRHLATQRCAGACDASDWEAYQHKAVASRDVLEVLWAHLPEDASLLVNVMTSFDLMFEERTHNSTCGSFFLPGLLPEPSAEQLAEFTSSVDGQFAQCVFLFHAYQPAGEVPGLPVVCSSHSARKLPAGLFSRLLVKASRWSQFTSDAPCKLWRTCAQLAFGPRHFQLHVDFQQRAICFTALARCDFPLGAVMPLKSMMDEICQQVYPLLRCSIAVNAVDMSGNCELIDLLEVRNAAAHCSRDLRLVGWSMPTVQLNGVERQLAPLQQWIAPSLDGTVIGFDIFLSYDDADRAFAGRLEDCIGMQAAGAGSSRVRVFPSAVTEQEERISGMAQSRIFMPIISSRLLLRWHHEQPPNTVLQWFTLVCALSTILHIAFDVLFTISVYRMQGAHSWEFIVMVLSLLLPTVAQAYAVYASIKQEVQGGHDFPMWHARHSGAFPIIGMLGCVRPDLMVTLLRCRAFGWDLFNAPIEVGTRSYLQSFSLVSSALHDIPQLAVQSNADTMVARVAMAFGVISLVYTLFSRAIAAILLSATSQVQHTRPSQRCGLNATDPVLLEWIIAQELCSSRSKADAMSFSRFCAEGSVKQKVKQHRLEMIVPLVIDDIGDKNAAGIFTKLKYTMHSHVPTATSADAAKALRRLLGSDSDERSATRASFDQVVHTVVAQSKIIDASEQLEAGEGAGIWEIFEHLSAFIVSKIGVPSQFPSASSSRQAFRTS
jgi:hypothetical protein